MSNRVYASIFYIALIVGSSWVAVTVGESLTRQALTRLTLLPSHDNRPSRVDVYLAAQEQPDATEAAIRRPLVPAAPSITVGELAKGMDDAEQVDLIQADVVNDAEDQAATSPAHATKVYKPRVAGWTKRAPKRALAVSEHEETSNRLIMRSLRAEM